MKKSNNDLRTSYIDLEKSYNELKTSHNDLKQSNDDLKTSHNDLKRSYDSLNESQSDLKKSFDELKKLVEGNINHIQKKPQENQEACSTKKTTDNVVNINDDSRFENQFVFDHEEYRPKKIKLEDQSEEIENLNQIIKDLREKNSKLSKENAALKQGHGSQM